MFQFCSESIQRFRECIRWYKKRVLANRFSHVLASFQRSMSFSWNCLSWCMLVWETIQNECAFEDCVATGQRLNLPKIENRTQFICVIWNLRFFLFSHKVFLFFAAFLSTFHILQYIIVFLLSLEIGKIMFSICLCAKNDKIRLTKKYIRSKWIRPYFRLQDEKKEEEDFIRVASKTLNVKLMYYS